MFDNIHTQKKLLKLEMKFLLVNCVKGWVFEVFYFILRRSLFSDIQN